MRQSSANEYKTRQGKVIHWELRKKLKFDRTNKRYRHNLEFFLKIETHKLLRDFEKQTDNLILARRPDLEIIKNKTKNCRIVDFAVLADHSVKLKEIEKRDKYLDLAREQKAMELEGDSDTNCN